MRDKVAGKQQKPVDVVVIGHNILGKFKGFLYIIVLSEEKSCCTTSALDMRIVKL